MTKVLHTESAPAAIGPYIQGIDLGNMVLTSGQIPVNPVTGEVPADIAAQAKQSLDNVKAVVESAGLTVGDIVKMTVFVKDLNDFATVNQVYASFLMITTSPITQPVLALRWLVYRKMLGLKLKRSLFVDKRSRDKKGCLISNLFSFL